MPSAWNRAAWLLSAVWKASRSPTRTAVWEEVSFFSMSWWASELALDDLKVRHERLAQDRLPEQRTLRDITHQQLDNDKILVHRLVEPWCHMRSGRSSDGVEEAFVRRRVVQLNGSDAAEVEEVSCALWVSSALGPCNFTDELVGLVV